MVPRGMAGIARESLTCSSNALIAEDTLTTATALNARAAARRFPFMTWVLLVASLA